MCPFPNVIGLLFCPQASVLVGKGLGLGESRGERNNSIEMEEKRIP